MIKLRAYGLAIRYNTTEIGNLYWNDVENELIFGEIKLNIPSLRELIHSLTSELRTLLYIKLLYIKDDSQSDLPALTLAKLSDNPSNTDIGWSFLKDNRNSDLFRIDSRTWLFNRFLAKPEMANYYTRGIHSESGDIDWNIIKIIEYFNYIRQFKDLLLVLTHLISGAPARGTELLSIRYRNTDIGGLRNLFIENGLISLVPIYYKGYNLTAKPKVIHRYLPSEVSILLVYYLWLIVPFEYAIALSLSDRPDTIPDSAFIWPEKERPIRQASPIRKRARRHTDLAIENDLSELNPDIIDTNLPPWLRYSTWTGGQLSQLLIREFRAKLGLEIGLQKWRHIAIAIIRKYAQNRIAKAINDDLSGSDISESDNDIADLQAGHTSAIAGTIYGRDISELSGQTESKRVQFYRLSTWLHSFYLFESAIPKVESLNKRAKDKRLRKWNKWQDIDINVEFTRYFGSGRLGSDGTVPRLRGLQEPGLKLILKGISPLILIMGTGKGKSLFFLLPALISRKIDSDSLIVIIVPLISLRADLLRRCRELNILADQWGPEKLALNLQLLLITPESALSLSFKDYIQRQQVQNRLDRIYIDECHILLDSTPSFRPQIGRLSELLAYQIQMIYLTATLPPQNELEWYSIAGFSPNQATLLREPTIRPNIRYKVEYYKDSDQSYDLIRKWTRLYPPPNQIIIYCGTVRQTKEISETLGCPAYYSGVKNNVKDLILSNFQANKTPIIAATSALGLGLDISSVRVIIHLGLIGSLRHYSQESGRAGRGGDISEAIFLIKDKAKPFSDPDLQAYIDTDRCRRVILDSVIDGIKDREKCGENEEKCDICESRIAPPDNSDISDNNLSSDNESDESDESEEISDERLAEFDQIERQKRYIRIEYQSDKAKNTVSLTQLVQKFDSWGSDCSECGLAHPIDKGARANPDTNCSIERAIRIYQKSIKFESYSGCFTCGIPQELCQKWTAYQKGKYRKNDNIDCQYPLVLFEFLAIIKKGDPNGLEWLSDLYRRRSASPKGIGEELAILGKKVRLNNIEINELCHCFWELYQIGDK